LLAEVTDVSSHLAAVADLWVASHVGLWIFTIFLGLLVLGLYRQIGEVVMPLSVRLGLAQGLDVGEKAPDFTLADQGGHEVTLAAADGVPTVITFGSPDCPPCRSLAGELQDFDHDSLRLLFVAGPKREENRRFAATHKAAYPVLTDERDSTAQAYKVSGTPFVYVLDRDGTVRAKGIASTRDAVKGLVKEGLGTRWRREAVK
jgi:methylamine dehydrogenase accessory protein MauD